MGGGGGQVQQLYSLSCKKGLPAFIKLTVKFYGSWKAFETTWIHKGSKFNTTVRQMASELGDKAVVLKPITQSAQLKEVQLPSFC